MSIKNKFIPAIVNTILLGPQSNKNMRIPHPKKKWEPPLLPAYAIIGRTKGGIFKSCPNVPKLRLSFLRGWGRCLKVTLQTCAPGNFCSCRWWVERMVLRVQTRERGLIQVNKAEIYSEMCDK
jgi:hypothetical protein